MVGISKVGQAAGTAGSLPFVAYVYANGIARTFTNSSAQSTAISATVVRLVATQDVFYIAGADPTATADGTSSFLPAGVLEHIKISSGDKIAALRETDDGTLYITPCEEA